MKERITVFFMGILMAFLGLIKPIYFHSIVHKTFSEGVKGLTDEQIIMLIKKGREE